MRGAGAQDSSPAPPPSAPGRPSLTAPRDGRPRAGPIPQDAPGRSQDINEILAEATQRHARGAAGLEHLVLAPVGPRAGDALHDLRAQEAFVPRKVGRGKRECLGCFQVRRLARADPTDRAAARRGG